MGWIGLVALGAAAFAALRFIGVSRALGSLSAAALMLGATGYALQQRAGLPGRPVTAASQLMEIDPGMVAFRAQIMPATPASTALLAIADDRLRQGDTLAAVQGLLAATARQPSDAALWTGLGSAFVAHDDGQVSPAARAAFRRAWLIDRQAPGPPFFLGLAHIQAGDLPAAKTAWLRALALTPRDAAYRVDIAERLVLIDEFQKMTEAARPPAR